MASLARVYLLGFTQYIFTTQLRPNGQQPLHQTAAIVRFL